MTQQEYIIRRKVNILELGQTLGNISEAFRKLGLSRQHYYDIKKAIEEEGLEGVFKKSIGLYSFLYQFVIAYLAAQTCHLRNEMGLNKG